MQHIGEVMTRIKERASDAKFFVGNENKLIQYFDGNSTWYNALIEAGAFKKMEEIIKDKSVFDKKAFCNNLKEIA